MYKDVHAVWKEMVSQQILLGLFATYSTVAMAR